ncbi:hypothetical protein DFH09DRAFT_1132556 [Mycena vulgaris]|nr:hypothetical protein DFH09DRAFT_1132556 [Mycena vulgaris]
MAELDSMSGLDYATFAWDYRISRYMFLCGFVILIYDHALTLGSEVELIWQRRLRRPSALWFLAVRYISLACSCVMFVFHFGNLSPERVLEGLMFLQESLVDTTLGIRVLAMYGFDPRVLVPMLILSAISIALGLICFLPRWTFIKFGDPKMLTSPALNLTGCNTALPRATSWEGQCVAPNSSANASSNTDVVYHRLLTDTLIFGLTAYRAYADHEIMKLVEGSLIKRVMKDGIIIVLANLANVFTLYILTAGTLAWWTTSLSVALIARLGLNLQRAGAPPPTRTEDLDSTELDVICFKDPPPPQPLEEATVDDQDFELAADRENGRVEVGLSE